VTSPEPGRSAFISYRRSVSWSTARLVVHNLAQHGFDAFMDVENIDSGEFEHAILAHIARREFFLVILEPGSLDRIHGDGDWMRREISHAIACRRRIVPLLCNGFVFRPDLALPPDIGRLPSYNAVTVPHDYFEEAMQKLRSRFLRPVAPLAPPPPTNPVQIAAPTTQHRAARTSPTMIGTAPPPPLPPPSDALTRAETRRAREALLGALETTNPISLSAVGEILIGVIPRAHEQNWLGAKRLRAFLSRFLAEFPVVDIGGIAMVAAPAGFTPAPPQAEPKLEKAQPEKPQPEKPAGPAPKAASTAASKAASKAASTAAPKGAPKVAGVGAAQKEPAQKAKQPPAGPRQAGSTVPPPRDPEAPVAAPPSMPKQASASSATPRPADIQRARAALLAEFRTTNPMPLSIAGQVIKAAAPELDEFRRGAFKRLVLFLTRYFPEFPMSEVTEGVHVISCQRSALPPAPAPRAVEVTEAELRAARNALLRALEATNPLSLGKARNVLLEAVPRLAAQDWAGAGSATMFLRRYLAEFRTEDGPGGRCLRAPEDQLRPGVIHRVLGWLQ
jgi:hypothetical protein